MDAVLSVCSVGCIIKDFPPGRVGLANQYIDFTGQTTTFHNEEAEFTSVTVPFDQAMNASLETVLRKDQNLTDERLLYTYWLAQGPQFETAAEVLAIEKLGGHVVGMLAMSDHDSQILTISKYGMAKRSRLGTADKIPDLDKDGNERFDDDGQLRMMTDGYRSTNPGAKGVRTMKLDEEFEDELISVRRIPDLDDNLFVLTKKGMMIRLAVNQTKETSGKSTRGTRIMELRSKDKSSFLDEIIFTARLPAELVEEDEFDAMDTDGDGVVSREEFEAAQASKDDFISEEE